ncbi:MAG: LacI family DNA-binding transcriptional regulator [Eubacteriales bacterium]|nr:LacI family DNA-binding transcriptional regulator [Eubacteriales bacterium]
MSRTIKDVAGVADVSIATVSHVINKTRYVSPDLVKRVEEAIASTGYKLSKKTRNIQANRVPAVALLVPDISSRFFSEVVKSIDEFLKHQGYALIVCSCNEDVNREREYLHYLLQDERIQGIMIAPTTQDPDDLKILVGGHTPYIFLDRMIEGIDAPAVLSDNVGGIYKATSHLIKSGHERIGLALWREKITTTTERLKGYQKALEEFNIPFDEKLVINCCDDSQQNDDLFYRFWIMPSRPTAIICGNNTLSLRAIKFTNEFAIECPKDLSIIGYGDYEWSPILNPPLTTISQSPKELGLKAIQVMMDRIKGQIERADVCRVPVDLIIRKSTQMIGRGPFGEKASNPEDLDLTEQEIEQIKKGNYTAAISFHYSGKEWMRLHEMGIRDVFNKLGVKILSITDAHFDADLQCKQLEGLLLQEPDVIISIPTDEVRTAESFKKIVDSKTGLVLINNVPEGLKPGDYITCVSVNERENGHNAGKLLGELFKNEEDIKVGLICHGAPFFATRQRDFAAEQVINEQFRNITIAAKENFMIEDRVYNVCRDMVKAHPEIRGIYVSWEGPAVEAMRALSDLGREDISIVTSDLDLDVAVNIAKRGVIKALSSQRPYEQGVAMAYAAANAFLGKKVHSFIGVQPYAVHRKNLIKAWKDIIKTKEPQVLVDAIKENERYL